MCVYNITYLDGDFGTSSDSSSDEDDDGSTDWTQIFHPPRATFTPPVEFIRPALKLTDQSTPLEIVKHFLTSPTLQRICIETNRYVDQAGPLTAFRGWRQLHEDELWRFLAVKIMMGINKKPSYKDYWTKNPLLHTPFFGSAMSRSRFEGILRAIHFSNNEDIRPGSKNRFFKLGDFMNNLFRDFRRAVSPGEYLTLDETLLLFKGRLSIRQYNPKKRARFGIKLFFLLDATTRFILAVLPYQGKATRILDPAWISDMGFGGAAVLTMLREYFFNNHRVVIDNYFLSPTLAQKLLEKDTFVLGTVKKNRKCMPKFSTKLKKGDVETRSNGRILIER